MQPSLARRWAGPAAVIATMAGLAFWAISNSPRPQVQPVKVSRPLMGTIWTFEVMPDGRIPAARDAIAAAFRELERIDRLMSEWKPDSPLSAINAAAGEWVAAPAELREMLERAKSYGDRSGGAFDITWRGMGRLWTFGDEPFHVPSAAEIDAARARVNYRDLEIDGNRVRLKRKEMAIGLGGIAKGYAVDRAAEVLRSRGFSSFLADGGGDVLVSGRNDGRRWRLGIQHPRRGRGQLLGRVSLISGSLVTSGDYERFQVVNGVRYHHIIDPRTGRSAAGCQSVSVIAPSAEQADALATAIFVLGAEEGMRLARSEKVEALIVDASGSQRATPGFAGLFEPEPRAGN